jgi:hypothetical protein
MNLDLLTKLVKLANNNPNDNEANLAARKVCKIIEEGKFNFGGNGNNTNQHIPPKQPTTWNDVTRSTEPAWKPYYQPSANPINDWFKQYYQQSQQQNQQSQQDSYRYGSGSSFDYGSDSAKSKERNHPPKRDIICTGCNKTFNSSYNKPEPFLCNDCQWKKYEKEKNTKIIYVERFCPKCNNKCYATYDDSLISKIISFYCNQCLYKWEATYGGF